MRITPGERRALEAVLKHGTVKGAANAIGRSPRTLDAQLRSVRARLDVTTTIEAVRVVFLDIGE